MTATAYRTATVLAVLSAILTLISCSGPSGPQPGTPAFFWSAAKQTWAAGDYAKTLENLDNLVASDNEYTTKAQPWLLVLSSGMSRGSMDLSNAYEAGSRANRQNSAAFRRSMNTSRTEASRLAMHFADVFSKFQNNKDEYVVFAFSYPPGMPTPVMALTKVGSGILPSPEDMENTRKHAIERQVLLTTCAAAGAPDDPAKTQDLMKVGDAKVSRATFIMAMANVLFEQSQIFGRQKLDQPDKLKIFCTRAQEALKTLPDSKQTKDLNDKIAKALKIAKG